MWSNRRCIGGVARIAREWSKGVAVAVVCVGGLAPTSASAAPVLAFSGGSNVSTWNIAHVTVGWGFTVNTALEVLSLGWYDVFGNGLLGPQEVGIWDGAGALVATATVPAGIGATLDAGFRMVALGAPPTLGPGSYSIGGAIRVGGDGPQFTTAAGTPFTVSTDPLITYTGALLATVPNATNLVRPTAATAFGFTPTSGLFGPNFSARPVAQPVPEPGTLALVATSLIGLSRRRRRIAS